MEQATKWPLLWLHSSSALVIRQDHVLWVHSDLAHMTLLVYFDKALVMTLLHSRSGA